MDVWCFILERLRRGDEVALLYVTDSKGSSPGRRGFKMAVTEMEGMRGSIGGGVMEQKLVEEARRMLASGTPNAVLKRQVHRREAQRDCSGLICSGEQTVALLKLGLEDVAAAEAIVSGAAGTVVLGENGLQLSLPGQNTIYVIGGGHVGLALSRTMAQLGFQVEIFDDREDLNTLGENNDTGRKHLGPLGEIVRGIPEGPNAFVAVVTFGFDADLTVMRSLLGKEFRYFGLMGSKAKLRKLFGILRAEGADEGTLAEVRAPIGLPIHSHTPAEIAISIAAEIIQVKNSPMDSPPLPSKFESV